VLGGGWVGGGGGVGGRISGTLRYLEQKLCVTTIYNIEPCSCIDTLLPITYVP